MMLSWQPGSLTSFYDYLGPNQVINYKRDHPDVPITIRFQHPHNWQADKPATSRNLAALVISKWPVLQEIDPYVYFANEVNLHYENGDPDPTSQHRYETPNFYRNYAEWVRMTAHRIKDHVPQIRLVCPPFAFGHREDGAPNDQGEPKDGWAGYDYLADTIEQYFDNILTFHAYWGDASGCIPARLHHPETASWYAFRWRRLLNLFEKRYNINARLIIDEAGNMDAGDPNFTDQAIYYAQQCLADPRVIALTYFLWEDPTHSPGNVINSWVQRCPDLAEHTRRLAAMPDTALLNPPEIPDPDPPSPPDRIIRVLLEDNKIIELPMEEYLRGVVPAEMPALWPMEALKAQAIAARTYATYAINHRQHRTADIGATTATQVYNPDMINDHTDQAIAETAGMLILYQDQAIQAFYSANCGGTTRSNQAVWGGAPRPYLNPVDCLYDGPKNGHGVGMCQFGARAMANLGDSYQDILRHYYSHVTISPRAAPGAGVGIGGVSPIAI